MSTIQPSHQGLVQMAGWWGLLRLLEPLHIWGGFFVCTKRFIPTQFWWSRRQDQSSVSCGAAPTNLANLNCRPLIPYETKDTGQPNGSLRGSRGVGNQRVDCRSESLPTQGISIVCLFEDRSFQTGNTFNHIHHHLTCPLVDHVDPVHKIPISGWSSCSFDADGSDPVAPAHSPCWGHFTDKWWRRWKHSTDSKQSACN